MNFGELGLKTETVTPLHPEHGDVGFRIDVCEPMSREYAAACARLAGDGLGADVFLAEAITLDWRAEGELEGIPEFSAEAMAEIYRNPAYYWIVESINTHIDKKKGYLAIISLKSQSMRK